MEEASLASAGIVAPVPEEPLVAPAAIRNTRCRRRVVGARWWAQGDQHMRVRGVQRKLWV